MKHTRPISKRPQLSQGNLPVWKNFLVKLESQLIEWIFQKTN